MTPRIRPATLFDLDSVRGLHLRAFPDGENRRVAKLAGELLQNETSPDSLNLVAEVNGEVAGHVAFSPVTADAGGDCLGYILAPLGVVPGHHGRGIGSQLVEAGIDRLRADGERLLFVYGDPAYYGRFGFAAQTAAPYPPAFELTYPSGWQALLLSDKRPAAGPATITCVQPLSDPALW